MSCRARVATAASYCPSSDGMKSRECINFSQMISHVTFTSFLQDGDFKEVTTPSIVGTFT